MRNILTIVIFSFFSNAFAETYLVCSCLKNERVSENFYIFDGKSNSDKFKLDTIEPCPNSNFNLVYDEGYISIRNHSGGYLVHRIQLGKLFADNDKFVKYNIKPEVIREDGKVDGRVIISLNGNFYFNKKTKVVRIDYKDIKNYYLSNGNITSILTGHFKLQCK